MVLSVHNNFARVISFILIITIILLVLFIVAIPLALVTFKVTSMDKYLWTDGFVSHFSIFPKKSDINGDVVDYHYVDYHLRGGTEIYLEILYSPENFKEEISRLENVRYINSNYEHTIIKDNKNLFNFITYISTYNYDGYDKQYEYACVDYDELRITYIVLRDMKIEDISFDSIYPPFSYYSISLPRHEKKGKAFS